MRIFTAISFTHHKTIDLLSERVPPSVVRDLRISFKEFSWRKLIMKQKVKIMHFKIGGKIFSGFMRFDAQRLGITAQITGIY